MRKTLLPLFLGMIFICSNARASHIVGGEFEMKHITGYHFELTLKMYFDELNGDPLILTNPSDQFLEPYIYRKRDNQFIQKVTLNKTSTSGVYYSNPDCSNSKLSTLLLIFKGDLYLSDEYNDPEGYYVVWERCCRNEIITNINYPDATGQAFYLEFPAIKKNGSLFINSSPALFQPFRDYACVNRPFYYDFSGVDPDGDSLIYSLAVPYAGNSSPFDPLPIPSAAPYREVYWITGTGKFNMIPGNPALTVDRASGLLFVNPSKTGLFVFSILCEEIRNGRKIGEVRRDFQLLVIDCPVNDPPQISVITPSKQVFTENKISLTLNPEDLNENRCYDFKITDPQIPSKVTANVRAVNFDPALIKQSVFTKSIYTAEDALTFQLCIPECSNKNFDPYIIEIISMDDGCSLPLLDTVLLEVKVNPPPNIAATISTSLNDNNFTSTVGNEIKFNVIASDADGKLVKVSAVPDGFKFEDINIQFEEKSAPGQVIAPFSWTPTCEFLSLHQKDVFEIDFIVEEMEPCPGLYYDTVRVRIKLEDDPNLPPTISISRSLPDTIKVYVGEQISWTLEATDPDNFFIALSAEPKNFQLNNVGAVFENKVGQSSVSSAFTWAVTCEHLTDTLYEINFIAADRSCFAPEYDTITAKIKVIDNEWGHEKFLPPNVFTPNNDGINETFTLDNLSTSKDVLTSFSLPKDICGNVFEEIVIVNRWGTEVFRDNKRNFEWTGKDVSAGVYYYSIKYTKLRYRGSISVIF